MQRIVRKTLNIVCPIALGVAILWWMYRGFDFSRISHTLEHGMNWGWMLFSLLFGVTAQVFRGLRQPLTLAPLDEHPKTSHCIHAVFLSYAASLVIPRIGEVTRCGILMKYDGTSFAKSLGTVITERIIDTLLILVAVAVVFLMQIGVFLNFFGTTGTNISGWLSTFSATGWAVSAGCLAATLAFACYALRRFEFLANVRKAALDVKAGILSLRHVRRKWLFAAYTLGIWLSYFLHFYITFLCFDFTRDLSVMTALVAFIVGSIAVVVPTPNGMGPWHFAVKTILVLYGVEATEAETFVLIVHTIQTALIPLLGIYSLIALAHTPSKATQAARGDDRRKKSR